MTTQPGTDRLLSLSLYVAPVIYLVADVTYALRGWDDPTAGVLHVLAASAYLFVVLRVVTWVSDGWAVALLLAGVLGMAGNVGYGFNTIHVSLGDTDLVDAAGAATLIKPLGLLFPVTLLLVALAVRRIRPAWTVAVVGVAAVAWPIAHIANIGWLAVAVNVALVAGFIGMRRPAAPASGSATPPRRVPADQAH